MSSTKPKWYFASKIPEFNWRHLATQFSGPYDPKITVDPEFGPEIHSCLNLIKCLCVDISKTCSLPLQLTPLTKLRTTLKFWSATMFGAAARNFGPVHKFELPTVIADSVPRATRVFSLASVGHVTGHMVRHMVPIARCRPPYWKIFTVNNLATVFYRVGFFPEETYFFRDTRKKVEETYFFQFCPDKTGRSWTKLEKTVKDVRNAGKK